MFRRLRRFLQIQQNWRIHRSASFEIAQPFNYISGRLFIDTGCHVRIGKGVVLRGDINVSGNSRLVVHENCILSNVNICLSNGAEVELKAGTVFDCPLQSPSTISVDNGQLQLGERTHIQADILVRFGGKCTIGQYTCMSYNTEIRCEEQIEIGEYCIFSYDVCIYDTNTHSTVWHERRERIKAGYPVGTSEVRRPGTKPVSIGNDVWLGKGATVTKGSVIGDRSIVGIRCVVGGQETPPDSVVVTVKPRVVIKTK